MAGPREGSSRVFFSFAESVPAHSPTRPPIEYPDWVGEWAGTATVSALLKQTLLQGHPVLAVVAAEELHQLHGQFGACRQVWRLEQRLLSRRVERRDLGDAVDQCL